MGWFQQDLPMFDVTLAEILVHSCYSNHPIFSRTASRSHTAACTVEFIYRDWLEHIPRNAMSGGWLFPQH